MNQVKQKVRQLVLQLGMDSLLGFLLRKGYLPRSFEPLAPLPSQYPTGSFRSVQREGIALDLDLSDLPDWKAYFRRGDRKRQWIYQFIKPGMNVWEIGCHKGWVALHLALATGPGGRVVAVDGNEAHVAAANERFRKNGLFHGKAHCALLSSKPGRGSLNQWAERNSASFTFSENPRGAAIETLDEWQFRLKEPDPDFVKITINGWELHALMGGANLIQRRRPALLLEVGDSNLRSAGHSARELKDFLRRYNYQIAVREKTSGNILIEPPDFPKQDCLEDVFCVPLA